MSDNANSVDEQKEPYVDYVLPSLNPDLYVEFLDSFIFGANRTPPILNPIPPCAGQIKFLVRRDRSGLNKLSPVF